MKPPRLHAVTDDRVLARPDLRERARALALGPDVALHVRSRLPGRLVLDITRAFVDLARPSGTRVIVNDRLDIALLAGADGVQLPDAGVPPDAARALGADWLVGCSRHQAGAVPAAADWVLLGPIWPTASHPDRPPLGPAALATVTGRVVAIGGITADRARAAHAAGAWGAAAITALWDAPDPASAARALLLSFSP